MWLDFLHVSRYVVVNFSRRLECGTLTSCVTECQQSTPRPFASYASAPNDVWSLGVILVNLTCGRNPWKRAYFEDSTFRAYMRDRSFLQSILPISDELNSILSRIFEPDPSQRITLSELRDAILACGQFTSLPPSPTNIIIDSVCIPEVIPPMRLVQPVQLITPPSTPPIMSPVQLPWQLPSSPCLSQLSHSSVSTDSDCASVFSDISAVSSLSSLSSNSPSFMPVNNIQTQKVVTYTQQPSYVSSPPIWYMIPAHIQRMAAGYLPNFHQQHSFTQLQVC
jgi:serine/threonine protein kinase